MVLLVAPLGRKNFESEKARLTSTPKMAQQKPQHVEWKFHRHFVVYLYYFRCYFYAASVGADMAR